MNIFFKGIKKGMYCFGDLLTNMNNLVLLFLSYFLVLGPTAIIAMIVKKKFLEKKVCGWKNISDKNLTKKHFYKQF